MSSSSREKNLAAQIFKVRGAPTSLVDLLRAMEHIGASDLYLKAGSPVVYKISGRTTLFESDAIGNRQLAHVLKCFLRETELKAFPERKTADVIYATHGQRYRVHFGYSNAGLYAAIRFISQQSLPLDELGLPRGVVPKLKALRGGLLMISGVTDSGKTVTSTALLEHFNAHNAWSILTLEDPIEYVLEPEKCFIVQREVGPHCNSFADGIRGALRENQDVIYVGEMRDRDTIEQVLKAAETGHLVVTTLHADDSISAIGRIIASFPGSDQGRIRYSLASTLAGVLHQRLLPARTGGRVLACEVLWPNLAVQTVIRNGDLRKLPTYIARSGGITMVDSVKDLFHRKVITGEVRNLELDRIQEVRDAKEE